MWAASVERGTMAVLLNWRSRPRKMKNGPFSVGHSNHDLAFFARAGPRNPLGVTAIADVRSSPYSKRWPHFSKAVLEDARRSAEVADVFLGDLLGGRPTSRASL